MNTTVFLMITLAAYASCAGSNEHNDSDDWLMIGEEVENPDVGVERQDKIQNFKYHDLVINGTRTPDVFFGNQDITIEKNSNRLKINNREVPGVDLSIGLSIDYHKEGGITVNGEKINGFDDIKGTGNTSFGSTLNRAHLDGAGSTITDDWVMIGEEVENPDVGVERQDKSQNFKYHDLVINGTRTPEVFFGNQDITIEKNSNGLKINNREIPGIDLSNGLSIEYHKKGGITVNGKKINGFDDIKGTGNTSFGSILNRAHLDGAGSTSTSKTYL